MRIVAIALGAALVVPTLVAAQASDGQVQAALQAAEAGQPYDPASIAASPIAGWVEYAALRRNIDTLPSSQGQAFLARYPGQAVAEAFRQAWLPALARRQDWPGFLAAWSPSIQDTTLRCVALNARQALGQVDATWTSDAQAIWRASGKALPGECDAPFALLANYVGLSPRVGESAETRGRRTCSAGECSRTVSMTQVR